MRKERIGGINPALHVAVSERQPGRILANGHFHRLPEQRHVFRIDDLNIDQLSLE